MATIAAIGSYFAAKDDPFQACYYLESIEAKLKTVANGGGIIKSENATIFGSPAEEISPAKANILLDRLTEYRGVKQQFENNHEEAIRWDFKGRVLWLKTIIFSIKSDKYYLGYSFCQILVHPFSVQLNWLLIKRQPLMSRLRRVFKCVLIPDWSANQSWDMKFENSD